MAAEIGIGDHLLDGLDSGNRLLGKRKTECNGADELAVNVDGASAHTLQNTGLLQRASAELGQNDGLLWADVLNHPENLDLEFINTIALEHGAANAVESGTNVFQWKKVLGSEQDNGSEKNQCRHYQQFAYSFDRTFQAHSNHSLAHISCRPERWVREPLRELK